MAAWRQYDDLNIKPLDVAFAEVWAVPGVNPFR
jgi:hypothetical protein